MSSYSNTGCFLHPSLLVPTTCTICSAVVSFGAGTSDLSTSAYPEISTNNTLAGPVPYSAPKAMMSFGYPSLFNSTAQRKILNTFTISKYFHPGQRPEQPSHYSERFALDFEPTILKTFRITKDFHPGQSEEIEDDYPERFALSSEDEVKVSKKRRGPKKARRRVLPAPTREVDKVPSKPLSAQEIEEFIERRVNERLEAALAATTNSSRRTRQHKTSDAKAKIVEEETEAEESTIVVDEPSDSEDEYVLPIRVRRPKKRSHESSDDEEPLAKRLRNTKIAKSDKKIRRPLRSSARLQAKL